MRLESYEDALDCIEFDAEYRADAASEERLEDYAIKYMLKWETRQSATLLNVKRACTPIFLQAAFACQWRDA